MVYIPPRPPTINRTLPLAEQARRTVWNARYTLRIVQGLARDPRVDQREARALRVRAKETLKRARAALMGVEALKPAGTATVETPETSREIDGRDQIRRDKAREATTGPPGPENASAPHFCEARRATETADCLPGQSPKYPARIALASLFAQGMAALVSRVRP
jgi:hypothetical protein